MSTLLEAIRGRMTGDGPWLIGIGGPVAAGKSTIAREVAQQLSASILSTDAFLLPNAALEARGLTMRKGFPESYDAELMVATLSSLRAGRSAAVPEYSHERYDIVDGDGVELAGETIVIEGIIALQEPIRRFLDVAVYIDTEPAIVRGWFIERFVRLTADAADDEASFYHGFSALAADAVRSIAEMTWDAINAVNLADHIEPSRDVAHLVVTKTADHGIAAIMER